MTPAVAVRSALAVLLVAIVTAIALQHADVPPVSALNAAVSGTAATGTVLPAPSGSTVPVWLIGRSHNAGSGVGNATATPLPTPRGVVINSGLAINDLPNVPGHIFYVTANHNLAFVTGHHVRRLFTGDGSSIAPALSPQGSQLAWVELKRNYSEIYITTLRYKTDGSVVAMTTTVLTQDQSPPPALMTSAPVPGIYDPRYLWWATKPSWLPNGRALLYVSDRPGFDPNNPENATTSVWEQALTDPITNAVQLSSPASGTGGHDSPEWRPGDPRTFIYVNYYQNTVTLPGGQGVIEAAQVPTNTTPTLNAVSATANGLTPHGATEYHPAWSPDGRFIAFAEDKKHSRSDLLIMPFRSPGYPLDYYKAIVVARGDSYAVQPFWSPDGRWLGYLVGSSGDFQLVIRRAYLNGRAPRFGPPILITQAGAVSADYRPSWGR